MQHKKKTTQKGHNKSDSSNMILTKRLINEIFRGSD